MSAPSQFHVITAIPKLLGELPKFKGTGPEVEHWLKELERTLELIALLSQEAKMDPRHVAMLVRRSLGKLVSRDVAIWVETWFEPYEKIDQKTEQEKFKAREDRMLALEKDFGLAVKFLLADMKNKYGGPEMKKRILQDWKSMRQSGTLLSFADLVRKTGASLDYGEVEMVDKFINGLESERLRAELLKEDKRTLVEALERATRLEEIFGKTKSSERQEGHKKVNCRSPSKSEPAGSTEIEDRQEQKQTSCSTCGKIGHTSEQCWKNKTCAKCGRKGHIEARCSETKTINIMEKPGKRRLNQVTGWWDGKKLPFVIDTGAEANFISQELAAELELNFTRKDRQLRTVKRDYVDQIGKVTLPIKFGRDTTLQLSFAVLKEGHFNLALGLPALEKLDANFHLATRKNPEGSLTLPNREIVPLYLYEERKDRDIVAKVTIDKQQEKLKKQEEELAKQREKLVKQQLLLAKQQAEFDMQSKKQRAEMNRLEQEIKAKTNDYELKTANKKLEEKGLEEELKRISNISYPVPEDQKDELLAEREKPVSEREKHVSKMTDNGKKQRHNTDRWNSVGEKESQKDQVSKKESQQDREKQVNRPLKDDKDKDNREKKKLIKAKPNYFKDELIKKLKFERDRDVSEIQERRQKEIQKKVEKHNYAPPHDKVRKKMTSHHGEIEKFEEEEEDVESEEEQENEDDNKEENDWEIFYFDQNLLAPNECGSKLS